jgi:hypothetical protein
MSLFSRVGRKVVFVLDPSVAAGVDRPVVLPAASQKREIMLKYSIHAGIVAAFFIVTPAFAAALTEADFDYLKAQGVQSDGVVIRDLGPKDQSRLHVLINDPTTANNPIARAKDVSDALAEFKSHQDWEVEHPSEIWGEPKRRIPN